jgi:hypothetical protein
LKFFFFFFSEVAMLQVLKPMSEKVMQGGEKIMAGVGYVRTNEGVAGVCGVLAWLECRSIGMLLHARGIWGCWGVRM